ncbi:hypothetical protein ACS0TY_008713 [Phlomoides rotata]
MEQKSKEWTSEENKLLENNLAEIDPNSPAFLENVASRVTWNPRDDVKNYYQALLDDIKAIRSGKVPLHDYPDLDVEDNHSVTMMQQDHPKKEDGSTSNDTKTRSSGHQRRKGVPWTEEEHMLFLMGLNKYGKGDWRSISRYYVISKTPTQIASHAQKYFRRQTNSTPVDRRRPSIHDIQTVTPIPTPILQRPATLLDVDVDPPVLNFKTCGMISPLALNSGMINDDNPLFPSHMFIPPMNNPIINNNPTMNNNPYFPSGDHIFNQNDVIPSNVAAYPSAFMLSFMMNQ